MLHATCSFASIILGLHLNARNSRYFLVSRQTCLIRIITLTFGSFLRSLLILWFVPQAIVWSFSVILDYLRSAAFPILPILSTIFECIFARYNRFTWNNFLEWTNS